MRSAPMQSSAQRIAEASAVWLARQIQLRRGMMSSLSGGLATMGCAVPYALAAKLAYPDRPVFALIVDGGAMPR